MQKLPQELIYKIYIGIFAIGVSIFLFSVSIMIIKKIFDKTISIRKQIQISSLQNELILLRSKNNLLERSINEYKNNFEVLKNSFGDIMKQKDDIISLKDDNYECETQNNIINNGDIYTKPNKSTIKENIDVHNCVDEVFDTFLNNGINIYAYEKECYRCHKKTKVYSYFLFCDAEKYLDIKIPTKLIFNEIGIGCIEPLDKYMSSKYKSIKYLHSNTINKNYYANTCEHCTALQGRNYVVFDSEELNNERLKDKTLEHLKIGTINLSDTDFNKSDIEPYFNCFYSTETTLAHMTLGH